ARGVGPATLVRMLMHLQRENRCDVGIGGDSINVTLALHSNPCGMGACHSVAIDLTLGVSRPTGSYLDVDMWRRSFHSLDWMVRRVAIQPLRSFSDHSPIILRSFRRRTSVYWASPLHQAKRAKKVLAANTWAACKGPV